MGIIFIRDNEIYDKLLCFFNYIKSNLDELSLVFVIVNELL